VTCHTRNQLPRAHEEKQIFRFAQHDISTAAVILSEAKNLLLVAALTHAADNPRILQSHQSSVPQTRYPSIFQSLSLSSTSLVTRSTA